MRRSKRCYSPIDNSINHTRHRAVKYHRTCDGEHLRTNAEYKAIGFTVDGRGCDGVVFTQDL